MAQKYKDTHKTVLKDTSDKTKAGKPEQSSGEHITKFFNRKGDEILKHKQVRKKGVKRGTIIKKGAWVLPQIQEKIGTIIKSNPGTIIKSGLGWTVHKHTAAEHDELMQYLREQHGMNYIPNVSWLLKDEESHVVLKNDQHLHEKLGLPDYIRVVKEGGLLHEQLDGTKYHPRFAAHTLPPKVVVPIKAFVVRDHAQS